MGGWIEDGSPDIGNRLLSHNDTSAAWSEFAAAGGIWHVDEQKALQSHLLFSLPPLRLIFMRV